jgi:molybdopterin converting factor small subunit
MNTKVEIAAILQEYIDIPDIVEVSGNTVGECLYDLIRQYPEARNWLFDQDSLLPVLVSINNKEIVALNRDGLNRPLNADDELQIFAVIDGG